MNIQGTTPTPIRDLTPLAGAVRQPIGNAGGRANAPARSASEPTLWELLTPEEQEFFLKQMSAGPITYRPNGTAGERAPVPTGRRIDVRG
jgi:hypothetical protein